jgi:hypothetical protein
MATKAKVSRKDLLGKLHEIIQAHTESPAAELRAMGQALIDIGNALEGLSGPEARATIEAVATMEGMKHNHSA